MVSRYARLNCRRAKTETRPLCGVQLSSIVPAHQNFICIASARDAQAD